MLKHIAAVSFALVFTPSTFAACTVLDYQEMKDMTTEALLKEACTARWKLSQSLSESIEDIGSRPGRKLYPNSEANQEQCSGQIDRIDRVLDSKGMGKKAILEQCDVLKAERKAAIDAILKRNR